MKKGLYYHNLIFLVVDILTIYLSIVLAFYTRPVIGLVIPLVPLSHDLTVYLYKFWIIITIIVLIAYYRGYSLIINVWDELLIFLKVLSISFLLVWMIISLQKGGEKVSRIIITLSFFYMLFLMPLMRFIFKYIMYKIYELRKPAYIFYSGWGKTTDELISIINREWYSGYRIDGYIDNLLDLKKREIEVCFVPIKSIDEEKIKSIKPYVKHFILISEIPGLSFMNTEIKTFLNSNIALITVSKGLLSTQRIFIKRMLDVFLSILGLILFLPFFLIIPLMIKMDSKGPVIFKHRRCGKNLQEFEMLKFRTMYLNGDRELDGFFTKNPQALKEFKEKNKIENDPRITRIGRILRKTSLDELPQLYNVLKGDMSIVGPRPDSKSAIEQYYREYKEIYTHTRPGITGLWQVSGRSDINYAERVKLDYFYILNWSMWLDIVIIIKTLKAIVTTRGAY